MDQNIELDEYHANPYGVFLYNLVSNIILLGAISITASIALIAICIVIVAIGNTWNKIKNKISYYHRQRQYKRNPTEIVYYNLPKYM